MRHKWVPDPKFGTSPADLSSYAGRVCVNCGAVQRKTSRQLWMRVVGYEWGPVARACVRVQWAKPSAGEQRSKDRKYVVALRVLGDGSDATFWEALVQMPAPILTRRGPIFATRAEAKAWCEDDARNARLDAN